MARFLLEETLLQHLHQLLPAAEGFDQRLLLFGELPLGELPPDWSDLLCLLELESSALLARAALLCAPLNPARDRTRVGFTFRCARTTGYGVSPAMARRCFEQLDFEEIRGTVSVLRSLSETDNVATQGAVWYIGGKVL